MHRVSAPSRDFYRNSLATRIATSLQLGDGATQQVNATSIRTRDTLNAKSWGLVQRKTRILAEDS